ncbi:hypothetical protein [Streptomyces caeruleatus]|uniref:LigA protein n=1 Tax=Streptomyces caeruleatus TaxID=661399 RepID=A0A117RKS3_9ACTN|nr:hypothetical protein [Streptomyces caeruleatus]KUN96193.1 hypothetical protein AQJ67_33670 [Streptomyces caeruleatus]
MSTPTPSAPTAPAAPAAPQAPAPAAPTAPPTPAAPAAAPTAPTAPTAPEGGEPQDVASLPAWAQKLITDTRAEAANYRTRAQSVEQGQQPAPPTAPQAPADAPEGDVTRLPQWAQRAITDGQTAARRAAVQAAIIQAAPAAGADVARLLDSQSFAAAVASVDPADTAAIQQAITNTLTAQPWLAVTPTGPARGGADFTSTGAGEVTPEQFARMSYAERVELHQSDPDTYRRLAGS